MLTNPSAAKFVPDGLPFDQALARCTHLGIGAHQDDLEFMAFHGVLECWKNPDAWFGGVICTDGGGSARTGDFAAFTDDQMRQVRIAEQEEAARLGEYGVVVQLGHPSAGIKNPKDSALTADLQALLAVAKPRVVYCHNPADKHETHIGVLVKTLEALRSLPLADRPEKVYGCEVWRDLDWMVDCEKVALNVGGQDALAEEINGVFRSQIAGGKRYDLAVLGRRRANATFFDSHSADDAKMLTFAMDLTPLLQDDAPDLATFTLDVVDRFRSDVESRLRRHRAD